MPLDPQCEALIALMRVAPVVDLSMVLLERMRAAGEVAPDGPRRGPHVGRVEQLRIPGPLGPIGARLYGWVDEAPLPALMYFHGGGFVVGDLDSGELLCRELANEARCNVVAVDYRLAPEHPFPAPPDDCYAATAWIAEHGAELGIDPTAVAVAGQSAGGNLAAAVALMARDRGEPQLVHQLLLCPVIDHAFDTDSYHRYEDGYLLSRDMMRWFWSNYLDDPSSGANAYASPIRADDFSGLAPATIISAEYDPLRDEAAAYAERLQAAGIDTRYRCFHGMVHAFVGMSADIDRARDAIELAGERLREAWADVTGPRR